MTDPNLTTPDADRAKLWTALADLVACHGDTPCRYDHHGYCQEHYLETECSVAKARTVLAEVKP